jgi:hypothetical protein
MVKENQGQGEPVSMAVCPDEMAALMSWERLVEVTTGLPEF